MKSKKTLLLVKEALKGFKEEKEQWKKEKVTTNQLRQEGDYSESILELFEAYELTCDLYRYNNGIIQFFKKTNL